MLLATLDTARALEDMDIPGLRLHPLQGSKQARWSVWVNGNWRLTFEFSDGHATVLDRSGRGKSDNGLNGILF